MRKTSVWILAAALAVAGVGDVSASGFSIYEQSAKASAQAGAWIARPDDAGANWYNPAALVRLEGSEFQIGSNLITIGSDTTFTVNDPAVGITSPTKFDTVQSNEFPSQLYFAQNVNDRMAWGIGVNTPFGLVTEWSDRPVTFASRKAELVTFVVNPNFAYRVNDSWSVAVGLDYMYADIKHFSRDVDQSALLGQAPGTTVGLSDLTGDGTDWGYNFAVLYDHDAWSWGLTYRAALSPEIEGDIAFTGISPALGPTGVPGQFCTGGMGCFPDGPGTATLDLPAQAATGLAFQAGEKWSIEFSIAWAGWSSFKRLQVDLQNESILDPDGPGPLPPAIPVVQDIDQREDWSDTYSYRLGVAIAASEHHEWRFGAVYDRNPIPEDTLRPSIPDANRKSVTVGYGFKGNRWGLDVYYMPLFFQDRTSSGDAADGVIDGTYESFVHLAGATAHFRF